MARWFENMRRHLRLEGTRNFRDIGGYPTLDGRRTRWRVLFRAGALSRLTPENQDWLVARGLKTVIDLRNADELAEAPSVFAISERVRYRHVPIFDTPLPDTIEPPALAEGYRRILFERHTRIRMVFDELLQPGALPAIIHCSVGKDRTGVLVALVLAAVGVPSETVVEDYTLSAKCMDTAFLAEARRWAERKGWSWERTAVQWTCPPELMRDILNDLNCRYGSIRHYLVSVGIQPAQLDRLRALICTR